MKAGLFTRILVMTGWLSTLAGCASAQPGRQETAQVRLSQEGHLYVGDVYTGLSGMAAQLKKQGFTATSRIRVDIPRNTSSNALSAISRELASHGYRRFMFSKPLQASSDKGPDPLLLDIRQKR